MSTPTQFPILGHEAKHGTLGDARKEMHNAFDKLTGSLGELRAMARKLRR